MTLSKNNEIGSFIFIKHFIKISWDISQIPLDDKQTFDLLGTGNTIGIFQLESSGMQDVLRNMKPDCFEDIIALVALYRPGPMDNIPKYIDLLRDVWVFLIKLDEGHDHCPGGVTNWTYNQPWFTPGTARAPTCGCSTWAASNTAWRKSWVALRVDHTSTHASLNDLNREPPCPASFALPECLYNQLAGWPVSNAP